MYKQTISIKNKTVVSKTPTTLKSLRGVGKVMYKKYGSGKNYLTTERAIWDKNST